MPGEQDQARPADVQALRAENEHLRARLAEFRARLQEPEEIIRAIRHGEVDAVVVTRQAGERILSLRTADVLYRVMIEEMKEGAVTLDAAGLILYCNRHFAGLVNARREAILGTSIFPFVPPEGRPFFDALRRPPADGTSRDELSLRAGDGTLVPVYVTLSRIPVEDQEAFCLIVTDLTGQKRQEAMAEEARRKDEFLAMLAHELRNPLAVIRNAVEAVQGREGPDPLVDRACATIGRQAAHLTRLVDDLLDVARITRGTVELRKEAVDLAAAVGQAVETVRPLAEARDQTVTVALPVRPIAVEADPTRLTQVLYNLLDNAAKYTAPGGHVRIEVERDGGGAVVRVRDTGQGIPPELLPRVFDLFTQGERSLDRPQGGLGLGLTLVRRLMELHGGTVEARSDGPGRGSEFVVRLPALPGEAAGPPRPPAPSPPIGPIADRVLVVDDHVEVAECLAWLLERLARDVRVAHNGPQAMEAARSFLPQAVFLDIGLPGMDGYEVARRLRREPGLERLVLVAVSGYGAEEDRRQSREAGFDHHLVKPVSLEALADALRPVAEPTGWPVS